MSNSSKSPSRAVQNSSRAEDCAGRAVVTGGVTTAALMGVMDTLLTKPGGYTHNDIFPPGVWLDNMPNWEYGVLVQSRDLARALREVFSRSQSQSTEDVDLVIAAIGPTASERLRPYALPVAFEPSPGKMGVLVKELSEQIHTLLASKRR